MAVDISKAYTNLKATIYENRKINTTPRSFTEDIFLVPTATELAKQEILMQYINALQSFTSMQDLLNDNTQLQQVADALGTDVETVTANISNALDALANNYNKTRKTATKSSGTISFWRTAAIQDSELTNSIAAGTIVANSNTGIQYKTTEQIPYSNYYVDVTFGTNGYMLDAPVECVVAGSVGNASIDTITTTITTVSGFPNVTNKLAFSNGTDTETNADFVTRMQNENSGNNIGTVNGLKSLILQNTKATSIQIIGANDTEMSATRAEGGCFDVYVKGNDTATNTITFSLQSTSNYIYLDGLRPVVNNSIGVLSNSTIGCTMVKDTMSMYAGSQQSRDRAVFASYLTPNTQYTLTYTYNKLITDIATLVNSPDYYTGADILVKEAVTIPVDIVFQVVAFSEDATIKTNLVNTLITNIKAYVSNLSLGESLEQSDIINLCYIDGIDRVVLPVTYFKKTSDTTTTVNDTINVNNTQYIIIGNLSITI